MSDPFFNSSSKREGAGKFFRDLEPGAGDNARDFFEPAACKQIEPPNTCFEECLRQQWKQPRRRYAIGPAGEDCQEYTDRVVKDCRESCKPLPLGFPGA